MEFEEEILQAVDILYGTEPGPIIPEKISDKVCEKLKIDPDDMLPEIINDALSEASNYVKVYEEDETKDYFFSRRGLFQKAQFCVRLTDFEITNGILVLGHRFLPFFKPLEKLKLTAKGTKKSFKRKLAEYPIENIRIYYSLFGPKGMLDVISSEDDDNAMSFMDAMLSEDSTGAPSSMKITVYDMKDFFRKEQLKAKDLLLLTVKDYEKKVCEVEALRAEELQPRAWERAEWIKLLSDALKKSIDSVNASGYMETMDLFLARALFFGGAKMLENPPAPIVSILDGDSEFELKMSEGGYSLIWKKNEPMELEDDIYDMMEDEDFEDEDFDEMPPDEWRESKLDTYCGEMGFSWTRDEIEAYMRDELFAAGGKASGLDKVISRCFDERIDKYYPQLKKPFHIELEKLWKKVSGSYNIFEDNPQCKVRQKALEVLDQHCLWIRNLDKIGIGKSEKLQDALEELMTVVGPVYDLATQLNKPMEFKSGQVETFSKMMEMVKVAHKLKTGELEKELR